MVLGPRAVFVLGCWVACSEFTDLVVFRPSSVASVNSRTAVQDSAIVQQPKDPAVRLPACTACSACITQYSTVIACHVVHNHNLPAFASCWLAQRCKHIQTQSTTLCAISTIRPPPSHQHCICTPLSSKQTLPRCCPRCDRPPPPPLYLSITVRSLLFLAIVAAPSPIWRPALTDPPINRAATSRPWYAQRRAARVVCGGYGKQADV